MTNRTVLRLGRALWRLSSSAAGAGTALSLALAVSAPPFSALLLASIGGSTVFLFGLTRTPAAQPRSLFGGHLGGACLGIACGQWLGSALWVYVLACVLTLLFMLVTRTVHPPAGATPLVMVQAHAGFDALWEPVLASLFVLTSVAAVWTRLVPGMVHYPAQWLPPSPPATFWGAWDDES